MKTLSKLTALAAVLVLPTAVFAQQNASDDVIEEVITVGSRNASKPRSASDSPVAIDVIDAESFNSLGSTADLTDNMKAMVPSYNASPATGDGSAFVRPTSLRGTAPDQMLVLVNGKRRHRSALVHFFAPAAGNGAHGPDIGMIPGIALKRVEVLRDGASSQYGSDAIAGVINFVIKDASEGGSVSLQVGEHFDGESSLKFGANGGIGIGDTGFVNASIEVVDNDALSRGLQRPDAQALIDSGVQGVGSDSPFGDSPLVQSWGRPESEGVRFFLNSGFDISDSSQLYARFSLADTDGRYRFFYRQPDHSSLTQHIADGWVGLPGGFTPYLDGAQDDASIVLGVNGEFDSGMSYDFSYNYGKSELDYFLNNTVNGDLPLDGSDPLTGLCIPGVACEISQRGFDVGGYAQEETNINADFSLPLSDLVNLAFGIEIREETFTAFAGEANSFFGGGSSGFRGVEPANAGDFKRDNTAFYVDIEHDVSDALLVQYAARYENFSDFGSTLNGKLAARYRVNDNFALRGAVSTGFHAPTPGQTNISNIITTFDSGVQVEEGLVPSTSPLAAAVGGKALTEENAVNLSAGFTAGFGDGWSLTADIYQIEVSDRIYRTGSIPVPPLPTDPPGAPPRAISFFTNALDVEHQGLDIVLDGGIEIGSSSQLDLTFVYNHNTIDVTDQKSVSGVQPVGDDKVEDIEHNYPEDRFVLTGNFLINDAFNVLARVNYYGDHFDENGRIGAAVSPSAKIGSTTYIDLEAGWNVNDNWRLVLGAVNVTDEFVDKIGPPNANALSSGLQYTRRSVANYEGGSYYLRANYNW
ncbi:MAG: TonB-dependent receptor plug domain-containing protein [Woeseiaceae bacterium]